MGKELKEYKYELDINEMYWSQDTLKEVDFIIEKLNLNGKERILDLGCGTGRHSLELARRGFDVVGVDIDERFIEKAKNMAKEEQLEVSFVQSDIRDLKFENEFDVVLNLWDGAVGRCKDKSEVNKIFQAISKALKVNGQHFITLYSANYAKKIYPLSTWYATDKILTLVKFEWNNEESIATYFEKNIRLEESIQTVEFESESKEKLYTLEEMKEILNNQVIKIENVYSSFEGEKEKKLSQQYLICSRKIYGEM